MLKNDLGLTRLTPPIPSDAMVLCATFLGDHVFLGTNVGLFDTTDDGKHWRRILVGAEHPTPPSTPTP